MHWDNLIIGEKIKIIGRGTILTVDLKLNNLVKENWIDNIPIKIEDTLNYKEDKYLVRNIEVFSNLLNGRNSCRIGLVVKQINNNE